ncbi:lytic transglycosylase domain-containing protein [Roseateles amylovorans]|uniref:Lytic transglycosylase domain-containing protein n=1 Tax=Roseateles amylovorans TaxID=2978473 RepID=A0ABY6B771_9BURK|nr:lytic transglycosylase domain-containing protein [Roseateles amylovorans]UXH80310.1 lytic transglycosylase domain-containing protein [Roseateles amylovorans]
MTARSQVLSLSRQARSALVLFIKDIGQGLLVVSHNTLALLGFAVVAVGIIFASQADMRQQVENQVLGWLNARHEARVEASGDVLALMAEPEAITRATAVDPKELTRQQAAVAQYLARRYRVAPEPVSRLVKEAWDVGQRARVDPTLILAIMAIESGFNPFAQSSVGAQGLMQVLTRVHDDKYEAFGGNLAAFDPITNLRVGVQVLKECIQRAGGVDEGLRRYVGAANLPDDTGYPARVLAEQELLKMVIQGRNVSPSAPRPVREPASSPQPTGEQVAMMH